MKTPFSIFLGAVLLALITGSRMTIAAPSEPAAVASSTNAPTFDFPKSTFIVPTNADQGFHDPFYPNSGRLWVVATQPVGPAKHVSEIPPLAVTALSGGGSVSWVATINGNSFKEGEEGTVSAPGGRVKIRCLKITDKSVLVEVNGRQIDLPYRQDR